MLDPAMLRRILAIIGLLLAVLSLVLPGQQIVWVIVAVVVLAVAILL